MIYTRFLNYLPTDIEKEDWHENPNIVMYSDESAPVSHPSVTAKMKWQEYAKTPRDLVWPIFKTIMKSSLIILYAAWLIAMVSADYSTSGILIIITATLAIAYYFRKVSFWEPPYIILWEYIDNEFIAHRYSVNFDEIKHANFSQAQVAGWEQKFIVAYINGEASVFDEVRSLSFEEALVFDFKGQWNTNMLFLDRYALETYMLNEPKQRLEENIAFYEKQLSGEHAIHVHNVQDTTHFEPQQQLGETK